MQARSGCPQNNCTGILELATRAVHSCLLSCSPSLSLLASQGTLLLNPVQIGRCLRWHSSLVSKNPKLVAYHDPSKHTYIYDKYLKGWLWGRLWNWSPVDYLVNFIFDETCPNCLHFAKWLDENGGLYNCCALFSNDFTYLQLFAPISFANSFYKFKCIQLIICLQIGIQNSILSL